jgi:hypothetical protein
VDCYFDSNGGPGDDDCIWNHRCDPHEVPPNYFPEASVGSTCAYDPNASIPSTRKTCAELSQEQSPFCHAACDALVPNGCDCFGCCDLPSGSGNYVWLGSTWESAPTCTFDEVLNPSKCQSCEPVPGCMNPCDTCELCLGKTTVPAGCDAQSQCAPGVTPCELPGQTCCPEGFYCITGCCQPAPKW